MSWIPTLLSLIVRVSLPLSPNPTLESPFLPSNEQTQLKSQVLRRARGHDAAQSLPCLSLSFLLRSVESLQMRVASSTLQERHRPEGAPESSRFCR